MSRWPRWWPAPGRWRPGSSASWHRPDFHARGPPPDRSGGQCLFLAGPLLPVLLLAAGIVGGRSARLCRGPVAGGPDRVGCGDLDGHRAIAAGTRVDREGLDPAPQLLDPGRLQLVDPTRALAVLAHEACGLEDSQVLGDGRAADRHALGEQADRGRPASEPVDDRAAGRVAENVESAWVLFHGR